ncbi:MAG TPA: pitrilysin family protein [Steroidobacteraceae bacterium]|nr:pitrilysin family protein [Steroidobacteraceae bacterium]
MKRLASPLLPRLPASGPLPQVPGREVVRALALDNGLKIVVWPDRRLPNVALYTWVRVGSRNEAPGITGLAHFFEHMMFNGTPRHPAGEFDRLMEAQGGSNNAWTSDDVTVYQDWFPRAALDLMFELEADRIANVSLDPATVENERGVVSSERALCVDDNNAGFLAEQVQSAAFVAHPYRFPTIGTAPDIRAWQARDLADFHRTYYAPNNITVVLAGDLEPVEAFALGRRHFAPIARRAAPPAVRAREPRQLGERQVVVRRPGRAALLQYAYKAPAAADADAAALNLLMTALAEGNGARLYRLLVERRGLAVDVGGEWHQGFDPSLCWFSFTLADGVDPQAVRALIDAELERVAAEGITPAELQRARNLTAASFWRQLATVDGKAHLLGEYEVLRGGWRRLFDAPGAHAEVCAAQLQRVARALLDPRRRTVGVLLPEGSA